MLKVGDLAIDSVNNQRCKINWLRKEEAGVSYIDEPWWPGSMTLLLDSLVPCEDDSSPKRFAEAHERITAAREEITKEKIDLESELIKLLMS